MHIHMTSCAYRHMCMYIYAIFLELPPPRLRVWNHKCKPLVTSPPARRGTTGVGDYTTWNFRTATHSVCAPETSVTASAGVFIEAPEKSTPRATCVSSELATLPEQESQGDVPLEPEGCLGRQPRPDLWEKESKSHKTLWKYIRCHCKNSC